MCIRDREPGLEVVVPRGMLYDDVWLDYSVRADSGDVAFTYQLHNKRVPLHGACAVSYTHLDVYKRQFLSCAMRVGVG